MKKQQYRIVRMYQSHGNEIVAEGLTLEEAQAHCHDPETSSRKCTGQEGIERTALKGHWFDGYEEMYPDPPRRPKISDNFMNLVKTLLEGKL